MKKHWLLIVGLLLFICGISLGIVIYPNKTYVSLILDFIGGFMVGYYVSIRGTTIILLLFCTFSAYAGDTTYTHTYSLKRRHSVDIDVLFKRGGSVFLVQADTNDICLQMKPNLRRCDFILNIYLKDKTYVVYVYKGDIINIRRE